MKTLLLILLLTLAAFGQDDFDVTCAIPSGWTGGFSATGVTHSSDEIRFGIFLKRDTPIHLESSLEVRRVDPSTPRTVAARSTDQVSREDSSFQGYPCEIIHHSAWVDPQPYAKYQLVEEDLYFVRLSDKLLAQIFLYREAREETTEDKIMDLKPARLLLEQLRTQQHEALDSLRFVFPSQNGPAPAPGTPPETQIPWATVIGVGCVGVLGTALTLALKKKPKTPAAYVLQLSSNHLKLSQTSPATLTVAVWKVDPVSKSSLPASDAVIEMPPLPSIPQLVVSGQPSPGKMLYRLQLTAPCSCLEASLNVTARAGGSQHQARVELSLEPGYTLEFF